LSPVERKSLRDDKQNDRNKCNRRSLDCGTHDDAVSAFARDDNLLMCKRRTSNNKGKADPYGMTNKMTETSATAGPSTAALTMVL
jgi:hypothetical protein